MKKSRVWTYMQIKRLMTSTVGAAKSEADDCVRRGCYSVFLIGSLLFSLFCALSNKLLTSCDGLKSRSADERYSGERGRIDDPEWVRPPDVLTRSSNAETWFEHMKLHFRAVRIAPERRAALTRDARPKHGQLRRPEVSLIRSFWGAHRMRRRGAVKQSLAVPYRPHEEEGYVVPVLRRLPAVGQSHPEEHPPAPNDRRHFGCVGRHAVVFNSQPGKRQLAGGGGETGPGEDGLHHPLWPVPVQSDAFYTVQRSGHISEAHGGGPERPDRCSTNRDAHAVYLCCRCTTLPRSPPDLFIFAPVALQKGERDTQVQFRRRPPDGATIGERGRMSENPRWIMPPEALTRSSDVERWFIRMERYFRAADVPDNRRAAMVQYHMDEAMGDVLSALEVEETDDYDKLKSTLFRVFGVNNSEERYMKEFINRRQRENESVEEYAGHLKRLLPKAFPQLKDQADGILLQQFEAGIRQDMIKFTILRSAPDSFEKAVKIAAREELMINQVTAAAASASVVTTAANVKKETAGHEGETGSAAAIRAEQPSDIDMLARKVKELLAGEITATTRTKAVSQRRRRQRSDRFTCWTCGQLGHISRDCHAHTGSQHGRDEPQSGVSNTNHNIPIIVVQSPITDIPLVEGSVGGLKCKMLVDTGAAVTLAAEEVMKGSK
ncbi:hypothetical protein T07_7838, partial [Trichinella nelsoni]